MKIRGQDGYAMAALLISLSVAAIILAAAMPVWKQMAQREKEEELVFRGQQYARAIGLFQRKYANAFPPDIDVLVREKFLRRKYKDPVANDDFVPLRQGQQGNTPGSGTATTSRPGMTAPTGPTTGPTGPTGGSGPQPLGSTASGGMGSNIGAPVGGIIGVTSKSKDKSIRLYNGRNHYNEWAFIFTPQANAPGAIPGSPGAPGGRPGQQGPQPPGGAPFGPGGFRPNVPPQRPGATGPSGPRTTPGSATTPRRPGG